MTTNQKEVKAGRTSSVIIGITGGVALGMWIASAMTIIEPDIVTGRPDRVVIQQTSAPVAAPVVEAPAIRTPRVTRAAATTIPLADIEEAPSADAPRLVMTIPVTAPELQSKIKPVLARGTRINLAVEGFSDAEQFATIAHAAKNTQVPFILLKHRVLTEHRSLADAIRASKPDLDAEAEVERARSAAKTDLAALSALRTN